MTPRGIIQNPRIGKKPRTPKTTSNTPIVIRRARELGHSEIASENFDGFLLGRFILATRLSSINRHLTASVVVELFFALPSRKRIRYRSGTSDAKKIPSSALQSGILLL